MNEQPRVRVAVVFGGRSTEHAISCVSAGSVLDALDRDRYHVVPVGISRSGRWVLAPDDATSLAIRDGRLPEVDDGGAAVVLAGDPTAAGLVVTEPGDVPRALGAVDVVFPLLHGPYGEDGTLQGLLELAGVPYVGSGVLASALAMDKAMAKLVLAAAGLPVGSYEVVTDRAWSHDPDAALAQVRATLTLPVFVKPARAGSSVGISKVESWDQLGAAIEVARAHDPKVVVEQGAHGREIECGVLEGLDGGPPESSVCAEIKVVGDHPFYDFDAKYLDDATELVVPADVPGTVQDAVQRMAVAAYEELGCEGMARVDFFLATDGSLVVNEVNTIPGFTPRSMFPRMWAASGLDYPALVDRLLTTAMARRQGLR
ncbi:MAG TPA: D-alanine--D-alanine ligase family protein [Candidatus Limnocylindria bacterium]|nr:D-alanine--D-alanine ligase family protein [Candidatus Limnocylindria bacterium]